MLFAGLGPSVLGSTLQYLTLMGLFHPLREQLRASAPASSAQPTGFPELAASLLAGVAASVLTNPVWVIKTRMQTASSDTAARPGMMASAASIVRTEGGGALFRGVGPSLALVPHNVVLLTLHDALRRRDVPTLPAVMASTAAAAALTYPLQVVRTRFQAERTGDAGRREYASFAAVFKHVRYAEGGVLRGMYAGFLPHLARSALGWYVRISVTDLVQAAFNASAAERS